MFDQTFVDGAGKTSKSLTIAVSFIAELAAISLVILIPLIWTGVLPKLQSANLLTAPAPPPPAPRQQTPPPVRRPARITERIFNPQGLTAPPEIPQHVAIINETVMLPSSLGEPLNGLPGGILTGTPGGFLDGIKMSVLPSPAAPTKPETPRKPEQPLCVGGKVQTAKLIVSVRRNHLEVDA